MNCKCKNMTFLIRWKTVNCTQKRLITENIFYKINMYTLTCKQHNIKLDECVCHITVDRLRLTC